jgi:hypothetical protein
MLIAREIISDWDELEKYLNEISDEHPDYKFESLTAHPKDFNYVAVFRRMKEGECKGRLIVVRLEVSSYRPLETLLKQYSGLNFKSVSINRYNTQDVFIVVFEEPVEE